MKEIFGIPVDTFLVILAVALGLAFGSLDFLAGQVVGKAWMVVLSIPFVAWLRRREVRDARARKLPR